MNDKFLDVIQFNLLANDYTTLQDVGDLVEKYFESNNSPRIMNERKKAIFEGLNEIDIILPEVSENKWIVY